MGSALGLLPRAYESLVVPFTEMGLPLQVVPVSLLHVLLHPAGRVW